MATATTWAPSGPGRYGLAQGGPVTAAASELHTVASPAEGSAAGAQPWNPSNPLFWFGAIAAVTFGLMAFSTSVRVGKTTASVSLGSTGK